MRWRQRIKPDTAVERARTRSRIASCAASGTHTSVSSSARSSLASFSASRRFVLTRSPGRRGVIDGATTRQLTPGLPVRCRYRP